MIYDVWRSPKVIVGGDAHTHTDTHTQGVRRDEIVNGLFRYLDHVHIVRFIHIVKPRRDGHVLAVAPIRIEGHCGRV